MQSHVWAALLRQIPTTFQERLILFTNAGTEIAVQSLLRIDREFVVVKGRLSGSQETGKIFFIPFAQIDYVGSLNPLKDSEFEELFGGMVFEEEPAPMEALEEEALPPTGQPANGNGAPQGSSPSIPDGGSGPRPIVRSAVLERFRARTSSTLPNPTRPDQ